MSKRNGFASPSARGQEVEPASQRRPLGQILPDPQFTLLTAGGELVTVELAERRIQALSNSGCLLSSCFGLGQVVAGEERLRRCLVLTELGAELLSQYCGAEHSAASLVGAVRLTGALTLLAERPVWKPRQGELWWCGELVKQYRHDAADQRCVLDAFQAQSWATRIDDPLPVECGRNRKVHLHETIKSLNRGQKPRCIRFHGDGTTTGLRWEGLISEASNKTPNMPPKVF